MWLFHSAVGCHSSNSQLECHTPVLAVCSPSSSSHVSLLRTLHNPPHASLIPFCIQYNIAATLTLRPTDAAER
jgi:hypothetical protein